ncbi:MAG: twin-arginine translocase TatA/TatE family subunit [Bacillota bacterium]
MGRLGVTEILLIVLVIVLIFGAAKLPQLARSVGDSIKEFKKSVKEDESEKKG